MLPLDLALPMPLNVKQAFEGDSGILAGLTKGKIWIDHSTTDFGQTQIFNEKVFLHFITINKRFNKMHKV
jgi:3-hydroxyisobutyrate dehydrogenase-like beta-hydroxyacid dehydrogenase